MILPKGLKDLTQKHANIVNGITLKRKNNYERAIPRSDIFSRNLFYSGKSFEDEEISVRKPRKYISQPEKTVKLEVFDSPGNSDREFVDSLEKYDHKRNKRDPLEKSWVLHSDIKSKNMASANYCGNCLTVYSNGDSKCRKCGSIR